MRFHISASLSVLLLGACSANNPPPPVSANPITTVTNIVNKATGNTGGLGQVVTDIQDTKYNLDQAIQIGILPTNDPVDACVTSIMQIGGITPAGTTAGTPAPSFQPEVTEPISFSAASYLYILAAQAKGIGASAGSLVSASCEQIIGHMAIATIAAPVTGQIGAINALLPGVAQPMTLRSKNTPSK
jgi:hypothetical protein